MVGRNFTKANKSAISEVSCKDHVDDFLRFAGVICKEFVPADDNVNAIYYKNVMERMHDNVPSHNSEIVKAFWAEKI